MQRLTEDIYAIRYADEVRKIAAAQGPASALARFRAAERAARRDAQRLLDTLDVPLSDD